MVEAIRDYGPHPARTDYDPGAQPGFWVEPGERFRVHAPSLLSDPEFLRSDRFETMAIRVVGPIGVHGARPGDALRVTVHDIELDAQGAMITMPGRGGFPGGLGRSRLVVDLEDGDVVFDDDVRIPVRPMIGKLALSDPTATIPSSSVGRHGGNMDCTIIGPGAVVLLPVGVHGAGLHLGDLHAAQGDGESSLTGVETAGSVDLTCDVIRDAAPLRPLVLAGDTLHALADGGDLDEAAALALEDMIGIVMEGRDWTRDRAAMYLSAAGDVSVCQLVNPRASVRVSVPWGAIRSSRLRAAFGATDEQEKEHA